MMNSKIVKTCLVIIAMICGNMLVTSIARYVTNLMAAKQFEDAFITVSDMISIISLLELVLRFSIGYAVGYYLLRVWSAKRKVK